MNDNEKNTNIENNENNILSNEETQPNPSVQNEDDTDYMLQLLAERKKSNKSQTQNKSQNTKIQTQTIDRPVNNLQRNITPNTPAPKPSSIQQNQNQSQSQNADVKRRLYNQDEDSDEYKKTVEKVANIPIIPIIAGIIVLAVIIAVIVQFVQKSEDGDTPDDSETQSEGVKNSIEYPDWITVNLLPVNEYSRPGIKLDALNGAVVHYVANPGTTAEQNRNYFAGLATSKSSYGSSNFMIGLDGEILMLVPPDEVAYCSNSRNSDTLSVECCHPDDTGEFTPETYQSLIKLLAWMCTEFDFKASDIIRHYDITGKLCPNYYVDNPDKWTQLLADVEAALK